jgi:PadR family transcriptional regulator, regulatory protein AphA
MELNPTAYVVLGMLLHEPRSGYEIKQVVDNSTRFFWAASYGQIYPELRRLEEAGLVAGRAEPRGGRRRTVYELTDAGREELRRWLTDPVEVLELRDEGLLKLFFAAVDPQRADEVLAAKQRLHEEKVAALRAIEPKALASAAAGDPFPHLVLRYGVESSEWMIHWCERARAELAGARRAEESGTA